MSFEHVIVHNTGTAPIRHVMPRPLGDTSNTLHYLDLAPGAQKIIRWDQAVALFGHPMERDQAKLKHRSSEYRRLRLDWGFHEGYDSETEPNPKNVNAFTGEPLPASPHAEHSSWEVKRPHFKVTTTEGTYIPMILDDPNGQLPVPSDDGTVTAGMALGDWADPSVKDAVIKNLEAQIAELKTLVAGAISNNRPLDTDNASLPQPPADETVTVDAPTQPRTRGRQPAGV